MSGPNPLDYGWWLASRSAGIVALVAVSISVLIGLMMANGLPRRPGVKRKLLAVHESTALAGLVAISVHGLTLLGDSYLRATIANLLVPFTLGYRPLFTGLGVIAGWGAALLGLSFYVRKRVGTKLWRKLHRLTVAVWALGVIHTLGAGTDAGQVWLQAIVAVTGIPIVFLFLMRMLPGERRPAPLPAAAPARGAARSAARRVSAEPTGGRLPAEVAR
ncbi:MAG: ferric reductase-like transmembrane domain-containing protein [Solirubrobacteraceae bacterium]|nr:ferric reductase-like transmembrane domain-containing protein [Solirubrobacteraceae bacterium]